MIADHVVVVPSATTDRVRETRTAVLMGAAGIATYWVFVTATRPLYGWDLAPVHPLFAAMTAVNLGLAASAPWWLDARGMAVGYGAFHSVMLTVILHLLGGSARGILFITYVFPIFHAAMFRAGAPVFITANVAAASYAALAWLEQQRSGPAVGFMVCGFLTLNFVALYANHYGHHLRRFAERLQETVAERTAQLVSANRELAGQTAALEAKQEELRTFVHTVTHDLKNPLNGILLIADLIRQREGHALPREVLEDLARIERLAGGTEDMLRDLLGLFRVTSTAEEPRWVELDRLVRDALDGLGAQIAAKGARVEVARLPRVWGQPGKLAHVVTNLMSNAVKYVPAGRGRIRVESTVENGAVTLAVSDNGIGIPDEYQTGIFDLFRRVPEEEQQVDGRAVAGSGVGLALVKRIVEQHHGTIAVASAPGVGSCFTVRLPREADGS